MKSFVRIIIAALLTAMLGSAVADMPSASKETFAMDTYMTVTCYGDHAAEAVDDAIAEIQRLNNLLSIGLSDSEISVLNANGSNVMSEDSAAMIDTALSVYASTGGAFDITILPIMELWGFTTGEFAVPSPEALSDTLSRVNCDLIAWDSTTRTLTLGEGQGLDLGGIAKGYTTDRLAQIFKKHGIPSAVVSLGGNVHCYGNKPDGSLWRVGIQSPYDRSGIVGIVRIADKCVITSGAYERYFEQDGKKYHHIIDPETGYPADSGLISVSIVTDKGVLADALSTSLYIMGLDGACDYWRTYGDSFDVILMTDDDQLYISEGLSDTFTSDAYPIHIIKKNP